MTGPAFHTVAAAIVGAQKKHPRKPADFYPTPSDVTVALLDHLRLCASNVVWEPACGDGSMARVLENYFDCVWASDLRDDCGFGEGGVDFLTTEHSFHPDWIITNPPFNVAVDFIRRALSITPNVAMLLKSQFWHARSRIELFESYPPAEILPLTWRPAFLEKERGRSPLMDVMWVIWRDGYRGTGYRPIRRPTSLPLIVGIPAETRPCNEDFADLLGCPQAPMVDDLADLLG